MSIRILYVFPGLVPPPKNPAFAEMTYVAGGITTDMLLPTWDKDPQEAEQALGQGTYPTYKLKNLTYHQFLAGKYSLGSLRQKIAILWFYLVRGLQLARKNRYDCVMGYNWGVAGVAAYLLSRLIGSRLIICLAGVPENAYRFHPFGQSWHYAGKVTFKTRLAMWVSARLLRLTAGSADRLHLFYPDQVKCHPHLQKIPASVLPVFTPVSQVPYTGFNDKSVLLVGAPWYVKGVDLLIRAFRTIQAEFPDWKLRLLGYFPDEHLLKEMIGDSRQNEILKARPKPEALKIIADCSVFALASRTEAAGRVFVEAMAAGKPLIGPKVGGVPQYVRDGINGLLFERENCDDLAEKLRTLLSSPELRERMGRAGYEIAQTQFTAEVWGRKMQEMIELTVFGGVSTSENTFVTASSARPV